MPIADNPITQSPLHVRVPDHQSVQTARASSLVCPLHQIALHCAKSHRFLSAFDPGPTCARFGAFDQKIAHAAVDVVA
jgi:hypothetical protein